MRLFDLLPTLFDQFSTEVETVRVPEDCGGGQDEELTLWLPYPYTFVETYYLLRSTSSGGAVHVSMSVHGVDNYRVRYDVTRVGDGPLLKVPLTRRFRPRRPKRLAGADEYVLMMRLQQALPWKLVEAQIMAAKRWPFWNVQERPLTHR